MPDFTARVLIAGGGSGGHVAPAIAIGEELADSGASIIVGCSQRSIDQRMLEGTGLDMHPLPARPLGASPLALARFAVGFARGARATTALIRTHSVDAVIATGGFVAAPALLAARRAGRPTMLLNLDDPPGRANRLAVRWADRVLSSIDCDLRGARRIAPPLRAAAIAADDPATCRKRLGLDVDRSTLLVTGASQGATTLNALVTELAATRADAFDGWQVLHLAGPGLARGAQVAWDAVSIPCVVEEFLDDMGSAWGAATLAVTRGGANTVAEVAVNAVPCLVLPYPYHADDHQRSNAAPLAQRGGAVIATDHIDLAANVADAGRTLLSLLGDKARVADMRTALGDQRPDNGTVDVTEHLHELLRESTSPPA